METGSKGGEPGGCELAEPLILPDRRPGKKNRRANTAVFDVGHRPQPVRGGA